MKEVFLKFDSFIRIFPSDFSYWLEENNIDTDSFDIREDNIDKLKSRGVIFFIYE